MQIKNYLLLLSLLILFSPAAQTIEPEDYQEYDSAYAKNTLDFNFTGQHQNTGSLAERKNDSLNFTRTEEWNMTEDFFSYWLSLSNEGANSANSDYTDAGFSDSLMGTFNLSYKKYSVANLANLGVDLGWQRSLYNLAENRDSYTAQSWKTYRHDYYFYGSLGRIWNATNLVYAKRIEEFLIQEGYIKAELPDEYLDRIALSLFHAVENYTQTYDTYTMYKVKIVEIVLKDSGALVKPMDAIAISRIKEVLDSENIFQRRHGVELAFGYAYYKYLDNEYLDTPGSPSGVIEKLQDQSGPRIKLNYQSCIGWQTTLGLESTFDVVKENNSHYYADKQFTDIAGNQSLYNLWQNRLTITQEITNELDFDLHYANYHMQRIRHRLEAGTSPTDVIRKYAHFNNNGFALNYYLENDWRLRLAYDVNFYQNHLDLLINKTFVDSYTTLTFRKYF